MINFLLFFFLLFWTGGLLHAGGCTIDPLYESKENLKFKPVELGLDREFEFDRFVIFYSIDDDLHGLSNTTSSSNSSHPDVVLDIAIQLRTVDSILNYNGYKDPLKSRRYTGLNPSLSRVFVVIKDNGGRHSAAYLPRKNFSNGATNGECGLLITLDKSIRSGNLSPAHELFHLYQNGYFMFSWSQWLTEGTANWSEDLLGRKSFTSTSIPKSDNELDNLVKLSYSASNIWNTLFIKTKHCDNSKGKFVPEAVRSNIYSNGNNVVEDFNVAGLDFVRYLFEELEHLSLLISVKNGWDPRWWRRAQLLKAKENYNYLIWERVLLVKYKINNNIYVLSCR